MIYTFKITVMLIWGLCGDICMSITIIANEHIMISKHITFKYIIVKIDIIMIPKRLSSKSI